MLPMVAPTNSDNTNFKSKFENHHLTVVFFFTTAFQFNRWFALAATAAGSLVGFGGVTANVRQQSRQRFCLNLYSCLSRGQIDCLLSIKLKHMVFLLLILA